MSSSYGKLMTMMMICMSVRTTWKNFFDNFYRHSWAKGVWAHTRQTNEWNIPKDIFLARVLWKKGKQLIKLNYNFSILQLSTSSIFVELTRRRMARKFDKFTDFFLLLFSPRWIIKFLIYILRHSSSLAAAAESKPWASDTQCERVKEEMNIKMVLKTVCDDDMTIEGEDRSMLTNIIYHFLSLHIPSHFNLYNFSPTLSLSSIHSRLGCVDLCMNWSWWWSVEEKRRRWICL